MLLRSFVSLCALTASLVAQITPVKAQSLAPYVGSPVPVVERMLEPKAVRMPLEQ